MQVSQAMSDVVVTVGPQHTLEDAARLMAGSKVGAAVVLDPDQPGAGIITERDISNSVGAGEIPAEERVAAHMASNVVYADSGWSLERAAEMMVSRGFRHLVVLDGPNTAGVISMRDIVRAWVSEGATCDLPAVGGSEG
ncbi:MAG: cyclic nucleotide-binding/CBS domain-containing protein [Solirubrobacterales bacterium]